MAKTILVKVPAGKHCPVCGKTREEHTHLVYKKDAERLDV